MKKLIFAIICFALVFAGYRAAVRTGSIARGSSGGFLRWGNQRWSNDGDPPVVRSTPGREFSVGRANIGNQYFNGPRNCRR
jgi:hypothetical protein